MKIIDTITSFLSSMMEKAISQEDYVHVVGRLLEEVLIIVYETRAPPSNHLSKVVTIPREFRKLFAAHCSTSIFKMRPWKWGRCVSSLIVSRRASHYRYIVYLVYQIYQRKSL